ncbi:MAG: apolipoprotein N-acyltransferase [Actinomycetota bacterium]
MALALAFPEADLAPLAWFAIAPLLFWLDGAGMKKGLGLGLAFGLGFFGFLLYWISIIGFLGWVVLVLLQTSFVGLFGLVWGKLSGRAPLWARVLMPGLLWVVIVEYARAMFPVLGFTWGLLAQGQHDVGWVLKAASIGGGWAIALLVVVVNAAIAQAAIKVERGRRREAGLLGGAAVLLLAVPALIPAAGGERSTIKVAIVQGNIPRDMEASFEKDVIILESHAHLTEELPDDVDLVVWPESSVGIDPFQQRDVGETIEGAARTAGAPMIVGGNLERDDGKYQVMAYLISAEGEFVDQYQKTHLVPFGEFVPARRFLDWIPALDQVSRDAAPGDEATIFDVAGGKVAPVISFEGDFGSLVRGRVAAGGRMVVVATNTSTWEDSWASAQHLAMSEVRAVENGVHVVHAALTGISAFVDPSGDVLAATDLWEPDVLIEEIPFASEVSFYARVGDWVPIGCLIAVVAWLLRMTLRSKPVTVP